MVLITAKMRIMLCHISQELCWMNCVKFIQRFLRQKWYLLPDALSLVKDKTGRKFIIIIDEWDVLIRDESANKKVQDEYIRFPKEVCLRNRTNEIYSTGLSYRHLADQERKKQSANLTIFENIPCECRMFSFLHWFYRR